MNKIAVLGVPSSGKTVLLAGLGGRYEKADPNGYFLVPESRETMTYVKGLLGSMKKGVWPAATTPDTLQELVWSMRQRVGGAPRRIGDLTVLDFAGEVYRAAFEGGSQDGFENEVKALREYVSGSTALAVLINLSDLIARGDDDERVADMVWATKKILDFAVETIGATDTGDLNHRVALVFTQSDRYSATIGQYAGLNAMFEALLPMISQSYVGIDILSAHVVDGTDLDDAGMEKPRPVLSEDGLHDFWRWLIDRCGTGMPPFESQRDVSSLVASILRDVSSDDLYAKGRILSAKLSRAMTAMQVCEPAEDVLLQFDSTVFGGADEGLLITTKAIYAKDLWADPFRIPLDSNFTVRQDGNNLIFTWYDEGGERRREKDVQMTGLGDVEVGKIAQLFNVWQEGRKQ